MKKIFSILFVAVLAFGMASCKSKEEKAVDEVVTLCDKIVDAANAGDAVELKKLYDEITEVGEKYDKMEKDGDLKLSTEQEKTVQAALDKAEEAIMNAVVNNDLEFNF